MTHHLLMFHHYQQKYMNSIRDIVSMWSFLSALPLYFRKQFKWFYYLIGEYTWCHYYEFDLITKCEKSIVCNGKKTSNINFPSKANEVYELYFSHYWKEHSAKTLNYWPTTKQPLKVCNNCIYYPLWFNEWTPEFMQFSDDF